jgi:hypothetical protein
MQALAMHHNTARKWIYAMNSDSEIEVWAPDEVEALTLIKMFLGFSPNPELLCEAPPKCDYRGWLH